MTTQVEFGLDTDGDGTQDVDITLKGSGDRFMFYRDDQDDQLIDYTTFTQDITVEVI